MKLETNESPSYATRSGELLKQIITLRHRRNPAYSLRAAARDLGVSHGYLSLILNGKKRLSFERAVQFAQFLRMDDVQSDLFLRAIALES